MFRKSIKALPLALIVASAVLVLSGCANVKAENGAPADQQAQKGMYEFQTPRYGADRELVVRIPKSLIKAAGNDADGLHISEVKVKARDLVSSKYCAVDLSINYRGDGLAELSKPEETEAEYNQRVARNRQKESEDRNAGLKREFGVGSLEELRAAKLKEGWDSNQVDELVTGFELPDDFSSYEKKSAWELLDRASSAEELDLANPKSGWYFSDDFKTLTLIQGCALSPVENDSSATFEFPASNHNGKIAPFASVNISVMKSGTLTVTEADVSDYERDSNGDWIGG